MGRSRSDRTATWDFVLAGMALAATFAIHSAQAAPKPKGDGKSAPETPYLAVPFAVLSAPPPAGDACSNESGPKRDGRNTWMRGYEEAMSGKGYDKLADFGSSRRAFRACNSFAYDDSRQGERALDCCKLGFAKGYQDLQQHIVNRLNGGEKKLAGADGCYRSLGDGRRYGQAECDKENVGKRHNSCEVNALIKNLPDDGYLGCASIGFFYELANCKGMREKRRRVRKLLKRGAVSEVTLPNVDETVEILEREDGASATGAKTP